MCKENKGFGKITEMDITEIYDDFMEKYVELMKEDTSPLSNWEKQVFIERFEASYELIVDYFIKQRINENTADKGDLKWGLIYYSLYRLNEYHASVFKEDTQSLYI